MTAKKCKCTCDYCQDAEYPAIQPLTQKQINSLNKSGKILGKLAKKKILAEIYRSIDKNNSHKLG